MLIPATLLGFLRAEEEAGTGGENRTFFLEPAADERLELEVLELEVSESEEPEPEVSEIKEVYLGKGAPELSQETQRELVSAGQWNLSLFWNPS